MKSSGLSFPFCLRGLFFSFFLMCMCVSLHMGVHVYGYSTCVECLWKPEVDNWNSFLIPLLLNSWR